MHHRPGGGHPPPLGGRDVSPLDLHPINPNAVPEVRAIIRRALVALRSDTAVICSHVSTFAAAGIEPFVCAVHPAAGIMCGRCVAEHHERHTRETEFGCDVCGQVASEGQTMTSVVARKWITVDTTTTRGVRSLYAGIVMLVCLGTCHPCAKAAGIPLGVKS